MSEKLKDTIKKRENLEITIGIEALKELKAPLDKDYRYSPISKIKDFLLFLSLMLPLHKALKYKIQIISNLKDINEDRQSKKEEEQKGVTDEEIEEKLGDFFSAVEDLFKEHVLVSDIKEGATEIPQEYVFINTLEGEQVKVSDILSVSRKDPEFYEEMLKIAQGTITKYLPALTGGTDLVDDIFFDQYE